MTMVKGLYDQTLNLDHFEPKHVGLLLERVTRLVAETEALYEKLHERWQVALGPQRWQQFHETLVELSIGWQDDPG